MTGGHPGGADSRPATAVIVPALDEGDNIGALAAAALLQPVEWTIVVDNGSSDDTAVRAAKAAAVVVSEPRRGYGFACAAGSQAALARGAELLVFIDGDLSSRPDEMPGLLEPLLADEADLVLGSRVLGTIEPGAMLPHQRFGNWLSAALIRRLYRIRVTDLGPFRAIRSTLFEQLDMREMTFGWPTEMTVKSARRGARIVEVPVTWSTRNAGRSKVSGTVRGSILAGYHILRVTARYAWKR